MSKTSEPCPRCGEVCRERDVEEVFGMRRQMDALGREYAIRQSYCRKCRLEHQREMAER